MQNLNLGRLVLFMVGGLCVAPLAGVAQTASFFGSGPTGGTNFGWGDRSLKMNVVLQSATPITIDCYWVYLDGPRHGIFLVDHRTATSSYEVSSGAQRNNGQTLGITQAGAGQAGTAPAPGKRPGASTGNRSTVNRGSVPSPGGPAAAAPAGPRGPYRGWLIVGHDKAGNLVGSYANLPEFCKLAPGAPKQATGVEGASGLNRPTSSGSTLKTGGL